MKYNNIKTRNSLLIKEQKMSDLEVLGSEWTVKYIVYIYHQ